MRFRVAVLVALAPLTGHTDAGSRSGCTRGTAATRRPLSRTCSLVRPGRGSVDSQPFSQPRGSAADASGRFGVPTIRHLCGIGGSCCLLSSSVGVLAMQKVEGSSPFLRS